MDDVPTEITRASLLTFTEFLHRYEIKREASPVTNWTEKQDKDWFAAENLGHLLCKLGDCFFDELFIYEDVWKELKPYMTPKFIDFIMELDYEINKAEYEEELKMQNDLYAHNEEQDNILMGEDPDDYYINNTDFPIETIDDAFEGDQDNVWNVD